MRCRQLASGFIAVLMVLLPAACSHAIPPPEPNDAYVITSGISKDGKTLHVVSVGSVDDEGVNVSGLDIDLSCADSQSFDSTSDLRIELLNAGCAKIIGNPMSPDEESAQQYAKANGIGEWSPSIGAKIARVWAAILRWFARDCLRWFARDWPIISSVVGLILGLLGLTWVTRAIEARRVRRLQKHIHIIIIGAKSAGKTLLWRAWRSNTEPRADAEPTIGSHDLEGVQEVPFGKFTIFPKVTDTGGSEPWLVMEQIRKVPAKAKIILVIVVAPCKTNEVNINGSAYDKEFIAEQRGYANLPRALLGERDSTRRPDRVVMFATKFDLIFSADPYDSQSKVAKENLEREFEPHRDLVESICNERNVPFEMIVGSPKEGWGINLLRNTLLRVVETSAK
jgi:hypothetical protein